VTFLWQKSLWQNTPAGRGSAIAMAALAAVIAAKARRASAGPAAAAPWRREVDADATRYGRFDYVCADGTALVIEEAYSSTGTRVWDMAVAMARMFERGGAGLDVRGARVLELGAGSGLLGMALHRLGADVALTECAEVLPHLAAVVAANAAALADGGGGRAPPRVAALDWREPPPDDARGFDVVVASDVLICAQWAVALAAVLAAVAADARLVLVGTQRRRDGVPHFLTAVDAAFDVEEVGADAFHPDFFHADLAVYRLTPKQPGGT